MRRTLAATALAVALASSASGCYGTYQATKKVNAWNGRVTGNKVANSLIHFGLWIIPVYELCIAGDFLIFNNIEFITGSNPLQ
ncbi:MAG: DUF3332 family protein [Kofleriaceae bacterium]